MRTLPATVVALVLLVASGVGAAGAEADAPMTTGELLSGMVTEEVEPGVFRVVSDGVRDLLSADNRRVVAGYDGGIWLLRKDGFLRLGSDDPHAWPASLPYGYSLNTNQILEVAPDGTMWIIPAWSQARPDMRSGSALRSTDGEEWTVQPCPGESDCSGVTVAPDGTAWASWREGPANEDGGARVGQFGPTGWQPLDGDPPYEFTRMDFTDAGDLYGISSGWLSTLHRYADGAWQEERFADVLVDVGPDGTIWHDAGICMGHGDPPEPCGQDGLARFVDGQWTEWTSADLPGITLGFGNDMEFRVAPDGSLWFSLWQSADGSDPREDDEWQELWNAGLPGNLIHAGHLACDGLVRFDGENTDNFLPGRCITMDIAADGSVWVLADEDKGKDLYVITPEAVAAGE